MTRSISTASERERKFFNDLVDGAGEFNPFKPQGWATLSHCFLCGLERYDVPPSSVDRLLDVGCGTGQSMQIYDGSFRHYTGVDLSESAIASATKSVPDADWMVADACQLPFEDESFNVVAFSSILHHIPDFSIAVKEAFRVLSPGGVAFAYDPNLLNPAMAIFRHPRSPFYISQGVSPNERPLMPAQLRQAFSEAGFGLIHQYAKSNIPYRNVAPRTINSLLDAFNVADYVWERIQLGRKFGTFVVTLAQKQC